MVSISAETKSICTEIASFQTRVLGLEQRVSKVEAHASSFQDIDQELLFLRSRLTDLYDRSRRDNVHFIEFPENIEGEDLHRFLRDTLPRLTGTTFEPPLEFQRAHRLGPWRADFSKETSDRRRAFLALRPRLRQLEVKYGLFDPARMWISKNGASKDFYNPEDLRSILDGLSFTDSSTSTPYRDTTAADQYTPSQDLAPGGSGSIHQLPPPCPRRRDLERLLPSHDNRGQVLHAVALHTQVADRDKPRSPLKPPVGPLEPALSSGIVETKNLANMALCVPGNGGPSTDPLAG
ncbi:hypothetical protein NDU88_001372 [Pleurodeles waltl]|uniref:Uncharacterized protein n=1 Tax=Pleurodeles waltl TaxID=8319 RepID=A0AAV7LH84_PLEWA|nr:hypothetical protein NDU88_001372 [Pleurodeles waltl]